ncbi:ABC transporter permease [Alsobacter metallidurans]|uniref:ABC transporter permease n=1 Tax=Alsobacter metallidurans TaxID=340221 RepID=A0A917I6G1_9HYPH|nr:ABC transporter permease subunit [Alsobacter metallidurans]GGH19500.1 ABC transporter permease [Alsobacter metallidurans]
MTPTTREFVPAAVPLGRPASSPHSLQTLASNPYALRIVSFAIVALAWEWAGRVPVSPSFPTFGETAAALFSMLADGSLPAAFANTLVPLAIGIALSSVVGVAIGVAMGLNEKVEWFGVPIFIVLQAAPLAALVPLLVLAYGIGVTTKVFVVCIMAMPVIVLNSFKAVRHTPHSLIEMGRSFMANRPQLIGKIILRSATPVIFAGLRLGTAAGFVGAILAELLVTPTGVGDIITYSQSTADYPRMYAAIAGVIIVSVLFIEGLGWVEQRFLRPEKRSAS